MQSNSSKNKSKYTPEIIAFVRSIAKGRSRKEIKEITNKHFNAVIFSSDQAVKGVCHRFKIVSGLDGRFKKGQPNINKGRKMSPEKYEKLKNTMFKKGNKTHNLKPVGSEAVRCDGVFVKVTDQNTGDLIYKNWRLKNIVEWEKVHGPVPEGHHIIFLDGNRRNFNIDNLAAVPMSIVSVMTRFNLRSNNAEITKTGINIARLKSAIASVEKKKREERRQARKAKKEAKK